MSPLASYDINSSRADIATFSFAQIGNEINSGILWPVGEISVNGYDGLSQLLHSAASGARAASSTVKTMIHLANGWESSAVSSFYEQVFQAGEFATTDVDIMGFSFYPFYDTGATPGALESSLNSIVSAYGKVRCKSCMYFFRRLKETCLARDGCRN